MIILSKIEITKASTIGLQRHIRDKKIIVWGRNSFPLFSTLYTYYVYLNYVQCTHGHSLAKIRFRKGKSSLLIQLFYISLVSYLEQYDFSHGFCCTDLNKTNVWLRSKLNWFQGWKLGIFRFFVLLQLQTNTNLSILTEIFTVWKYPKILGYINRNVYSLEIS